MYICKENMAEIAEKLDSNKTLEELCVDEMVVMDMAYQLQYFFEAKETIDAKPELKEASEFLHMALIDKEA